VQNVQRLIAIDGLEQVSVVLKCDVGGRGFGAAVEACVDARAAWAAEAAGVLCCRAAAKVASLAAEARLGGMGLTNAPQKVQ
jgi:hypothetical protein